MKVLVVGGGAREHALCWLLSQSPKVDRIYVAPGNAGIAQVATLVRIGPSDVEGLARFAERQSIDLTVVGPEEPLVAGLVDVMAKRDLPAFGPTREAARIEGSKVWARRLCEAHGIPSPMWGEFEDLRAALNYLERTDPPYVVKADGLAAGKGVTVAEDLATARRALEECLVRGAFGEAGRRVVVEEHLQGPEVSAIALTDGRNVVPLSLAHDYKRALDGDRGPNTGGMGSFSPVPFVSAGMRSEILERILRPAVRAIQHAGVEYRGVLYAGLMVTPDGPKVLEFNCRFGDPETQVLLPRLKSDLAELLMACAGSDVSDWSHEGQGRSERLEWREQSCVGVVLASEGYPGSVRTRKPIFGLDEAAASEDVHLFHAGTAAEDGRVVTAGGRVLTVSALGSDLGDARRRAYDACSLIQFDGMSYRRDIAEAVQRGTG